MINRFFLIFIFGFFSIISFPNKSEALFDLFTVYGTRNTKIKNEILKILNKNLEKKVWKQDGIAYPHELEMQFKFILEDSDRQDDSKHYEIFSYMGTKN